ncbi:MAG: hypothetical protein ACXWKC_06920 [Xanthobacteraceae bacterium]
MTAMTPALRKVSVMLVIASGLGLAGCEDSKLMELLDNKPRLAGTRTPVFPEGVPGVQQGVPPELMRGYQAQVEQQAQTQAAPADTERAAAEERKKAEADKPKRVAQPRPPRPAAQPQPAQQADAPAAAQPPQPTGAPLADRWPSAQQETQQSAPPPPPQRSATTMPWPGSAPPAPPTDRFSR